MEKLREKGVNILSKYIKKEKNIKIIEKNIFVLSEFNHTKYLNILYQIIYMFTDNKNVTEIFKYLKDKKIDYDLYTYEECKKLENEYDNYISSDKNVEEGIYKCNNCKQNKTFSYTIQTRSCDEGASVFVFCSICKKKWKEN